MDGNQFDTMVMSLGSEASRRRMLAALLGGVLGMAGWAGSEAKTSRKCKPKCNECQFCRKGTCKKKNGKKTCKAGKCKQLTNGTACSGGGTCQGGVCTCATGQTSCNGTCTNLQTDEANCGACGTACAAGETCCNGTCANLQTDEAHCGACGTVCSTNQVCQAGACFPKDACPATIGGFCGAFIDCGEIGAQCRCGLSAEGNIVCVTTAGAPACPGTACTSSASCAAGSACIDITGCCPGATKTCFPKCPAPVPA